MRWLYYLSPSGSDLQEGTAPQKAWQTISRVNKASLQPGDSVLLEGGSIDDAARLGTLRAYGLLPSSPLAGKGLDLQRLFQVAPSVCDFHGTPLRPGMKFSLGAIQDLPRRRE